MALISSLERTRSVVCFSTFRIFPRIGKIAWNLRFLPVLAVPAADFVFTGISVGTDYLFAPPCQGFNASNISQCVSIAPVLTNNGDSRYRVSNETSTGFASPKCVLTFACNGQHSPLATYVTPVITGKKDKGKSLVHPLR